MAIKEENLNEETVDTEAQEIEIEGAEETATAASEEEEAAAEEDAQGETESCEEDEQEAAEEDTETAETKDASADSRKKWRKDKKKDKKDVQIEELTDRVKRQMAEFDNFRKRTEKEKTQMFETGAKSIIEKILPVVDNFERGLAAIPEEEKESAFADGMEKIYKQMMTMLEEAGVTVIEAAGKEFDPNLHNAVMHIDDDNFGENIVAEEFQKGYMYRDSVVRHSMVKVAN